MSSRTLVSVAAVVLSLSALTGCGSSIAVQAAERGDYAGLRQRLATTKKAMDGGEARAIARAVVKHELATAKPEDAVQRIDEVRGCLVKVDDLVAQRAKTHDAAGARAAFFLLDSGIATGDKWRDEVSSEDGAWRAVGARLLVSRGQGAKRRELFLDLDARVRRSAMYAAAEAGDAADTPLLLETVRLDPDTLARDAALRAVGRIGSRDIVLSLRDRWATGDEPLRGGIVSAWGTRAGLDAGGRDQLVWVVETTRGVPAIDAAAILMRGDGADVGIGRAGLLRAIDDGPTETRVVALNLAPLSDPAVLEGVKKASEAPDLRVKVAALSRLASVPASRAAALDALGPLAAGNGGERNAARTALAQAGDRRVVTLLEQDISAPEPGVRAWAAAQLASMKEWPSAAPALADDDPSVRTRSACSILSVRR